MYDGVFSLDGDPLRGTFTIATTDVYQTLEALLVNLTAPNGQRAQGAFISVETNAARFLFPGAGVVGHSIASAGSISIKAASINKGSI